MSCSCNFRITEKKIAHFVSGMDTRTNLHLCFLRIFQTEKKKPVSYWCTLHFPIVHKTESNKLMCRNVHTYHSSHGVMSGDVDNKLSSDVWCSYFLEPIWLHSFILYLEVHNSDFFFYQSNIHDDDCIFVMDGEKLNGGVGKGLGHFHCKYQYMTLCICVSGSALSLFSKG